MSLRLGAVKSCGDCRRKAECSLIKGKDAKVFPKEKQKNEAPFLKEWGGEESRTLFVVRVHQKVHRCVYPERMQGCMSRGS